MSDDLIKRDDALAELAELEVKEITKGTMV